MKEPGAGRVKKRRKSVVELTKESQNKLCLQVEYYFSDSNLPSDDFLQKTIKDNDGWVPIENLINFPRVFQLLEKAEREIPGVDVTKHLTDALRSSKILLQVSEDGLRVQRATALVDPQIVADRTVAVFGFPSKREFEVDEQKMFWGQFGGVLSVRRYVPGNGQSANCIVFVEFDTKEIAQDVIATEMLDYDGIEVTLKKRLLPSRKRKRSDQPEHLDRLLKLSGFPKRATFMDIRNWIEKQDIKGRCFVHLQKGFALVRFTGEVSAKEAAEKLDNKQWQQDQGETLMKAEVIEDKGVTWKSLMAKKSAKRRKFFKRGARDSKRKEKLKADEEKKMDDDT